MWKNVHFTLVGHGQLAHPAGGRWDEWYAAFSDGRWGWLAEAQGQLYLTFRGNVPSIPAFDSIEIGARVIDDFVAAEKGEARTLAAEGEMPFVIGAESRHRFRNRYRLSSTSSFCAATRIRS